MICEVNVLTIHRQYYLHANGVLSVYSIRHTQSFIAYLVQILLCLVFGERTRQVEGSILSKVRLIFHRRSAQQMIYDVIFETLVFVVLEVKIFPPFCSIPLNFYEQVILNIFHDYG